MQTFCQYTIYKELGRGGMGTVYLAKNAKGESFALKVMGVHLLRDEGSRARFKREPKLSPVHPNIVRVLDSGECNGTPFFVMELVEGESLDAILRRQKVLPATQLIELLRGVASALDHVHGRGIIHRDIKPSNILVNKDGHVYLTDFGVAKNTAAGAATYMSVTGSRIGTAHYMSPEQAMGKRDLTAAADIYALGVMAFHALAGRVPFDADSDVVVARMHMQDVPPDLRKLNPQVPQQVADVVMRAMRKDPAKRFASANAFVNALAQALDKPVAQPVLARPTVWGGLALVVVLVSIGLLLVLSGRENRRDSAGTGDPKASPAATVAKSQQPAALTPSSGPAVPSTTPQLLTSGPSSLPTATSALVAAQPVAGATSTLAPTREPEPTATRPRPTSVARIVSTVTSGPIVSVHTPTANAPTTTDNPPAGGGNSDGSGGSNNNPPPPPQPQPELPTAAPNNPQPTPAP